MAAADQTIPVRDYRTLTNEHLVPHSHAKRSAHDNRSYMVGALARLTLNGDRIGAGAQGMGGTAACHPLHQHRDEQYRPGSGNGLFRRARPASGPGSARSGIAPEPPAPYHVRACQGAAATEVPRGTLFYSYELDAEGRVAAADVITPTAQNLNNAEDQMRAAVQQGAGAGAPDDVLEQRLAIVARAYDPCISCSVHLMRC